MTRSERKPGGRGWEGERRCGSRREGHSELMGGMDTTIPDTRFSQTKRQAISFIACDKL